MLDINRVDSYGNIIQTDSSVTETKKTSSFSSYLGESATLSDIFERAASKYNISVDLLKAVGKQESNFNPNAVSRCGAQGIMQLMPATAASLGVTDSFDAEQNIMGGAKYLSSLLDTYDGNVSFALAAYNAGGNNVNKYGGIPPFKETQDYVVKVTAYMQTGVDVPNVTYATTRFNDTITNDKGLPDQLLKAMEELKEAFNYDDYLTFVNLFINNKVQDSKEEEEAQKANNSSGSDYSSLNQINYSPSILNLLTSL